MERLFFKITEITLFITKKASIFSKKQCAKRNFRKISVGVNSAPLRKNARIMLLVGMRKETMLAA